MKIKRFTKHAMRLTAIGASTSLLGVGCSFDGPEQREVEPVGKLSFSYHDRKPLNLGTMFDAITVDAKGNIKVIDGDPTDRREYNTVEQVGTLPTDETAEVKRTIVQTIEEIGTEGRKVGASNILFYDGETVDYCSVYVTFNSKYEGEAHRVRDLPEGLCVDLGRVVFSNARPIDDPAYVSHPISR